MLLGWQISSTIWAGWRRRGLSRWMSSTRRSCGGQWPIRSLAEASWPMSVSCFRFSSQGWVSNWDHSAPSVWLTAYVIRILEAASFQESTNRIELAKTSSVFLVTSSRRRFYWFIFFSGLGGLHLHWPHGIWLRRDVASQLSKWRGNNIESNNYFASNLSRNKIKGFLLLGNNNLTLHSLLNNSFCTLLI